MNVQWRQPVDGAEYASASCNIGTRMAFKQTAFGGRPAWEVSTGVRQDDLIDLLRPRTETFA